MSELLKVSSNPHVRARMKTDNIMLLVLIALTAGSAFFGVCEFWSPFPGSSGSFCGVGGPDGVSL